MEHGVYIHFPFCTSRCGYCDFYSTVGDVPHREYADAVLGELERRRPELGQATLGSVYIGGGTPSIWDHHELRRVLDGVIGAFPRDRHVVEVTVEVNPGSVSAEGLDHLRHAGVNRVSVGVQSMDDDVLRLLNRRHQVGQSRATVRWARDAGFANVSCDLIFGLPGQTVDQHLRGIQVLVELDPDHISAYSLTLAAGTPLSREGLRPAEADLAAEMMERGRGLLGELGHPQYEVSNYAQARYQVRHNNGVWAGAPYLGLGAGAHSLRWQGKENIRTRNPELRDYLAGVGGRVERLGEAKSRFEMLFLGLRTVVGVDREAFSRRFDQDPVDGRSDLLSNLQRAGLVEVTQRHLRPTPRGIWFADELAIRCG